MLANYRFGRVGSDKQYYRRQLGSARLLCLKIDIDQQAFLVCSSANNRHPTFEGVVRVI